MAVISPVLFRFAIITRYIASAVAIGAADIEDYALLAADDNTLCCHEEVIGDIVGIASVHVTTLVNWFVTLTTTRWLVTFTDCYRFGPY